MGTYPIKALGATGVISDLAHTDLPPNAFTDAINARFVENRVFKTGGCSPVSYIKEDKDIVPLSFISMPFDYYSSGNSFIIVGTEKKLMRLTNEALTDISRKVPLITRKASSKVKVFPILAKIVPKQPSYRVEINKSVNMEVTLDPEDIRDKTLTWELSNSSYATIEVDQSNNTKAVLKAKEFEGNLVVTVSNPDKSVTVDIPVVIFDQDSGIFLSRDSLTFRKGATSTLVATSTKTPVDWVSSNSSVVKVESGKDTLNATLTAVKEGTAIITASNGTKSAVCSVTVISQIDSISISPSTLRLSVNTEGRLKVNFNPDAPLNKKVTWKSLDTSVATVGSEGTEVIVKGIRNGTTSIVATSEEGEKEARCIIYVGNTFSSRTKRELTQDLTPAYTIDTTKMYKGNRFYDYTNVLDLEGYGYAISTMEEIPITGITVDITYVEIDVDEEITITANIEPVDATNVTYKWLVNKSGFVSVDETNKSKIKITGLKKGEITITCTASQMVQKDYTTEEQYPWYHAVIANCAIATTYNEPPQVKIYDEEFFQDLPGWGEQTIVDIDGIPSVNKYNWRCERVRAFNNRLFALNMREANASGVITHYPLRLRWSNFAKENHPPVLWDDDAYDRVIESDAGADAVGQVEALQDGYAGYIDLADSNGNLLDMLPLKDYLFVYTEFETYVGSPTMNSYQPLLFKKLFNDSGILAPDCVCEVEGQHFVVTQNDIIVHNGVVKRSIASNRVKEKIINEVCLINPLATKVHLHQDKKEVWILYVGEGQEKGSRACTKAAVWNYEYDTWSFRTIPLSPCIGLVDPPLLEKGPIWYDFQDISWDDPRISDLVWRKNATNFHQRITIVGSYMKGFYQIDIGAWDYSWDTNNNKVVKSPLYMMLERSGIDFDNATNDWSQKHVTKFRPLTTGTGTISFESGGSQYSNEFGHWHSSRPFILGKDRNVSVRLNHPYLFYRIIDQDVNSDATVNGLTIEYVVGGRR